MKYLPRKLESALLKAVSQFPVVVLTGPRQSGKTTLLLEIFGRLFHYASLDEPKVSQLAALDPELFFETYPAPLILDEIQYAPQLLTYIKLAVDKNRQKEGQFLLTGSQQFPFIRGVTESLAGRAAVFNLLSMSLEERWVKVPKNLSLQTLAEAWIRGGFPRLVANPQLDFQTWHAGYLRTYLERDVRDLRQVGNLGEFQLFLEALATRNAQILSLSDLSKELGVAVNTIKAWVSVLEASHQIVLVRPYFRNKGKRLIKAPKVFFLDTGLLCYLIGLQDANHAIKGPAAGSLLETAVFGELLRAFVHRGRIPRIYFWRTVSGEEVDFIMESSSGLIPIEVKLTKTPAVGLCRNLEKFCQIFPEAKKGYLLCPISEKIVLSRTCAAVPISFCSSLVQ